VSTVHPYWCVDRDERCLARRYHAGRPVKIRTISDDYATLTSQIRQSTVLGDPYLRVASGRIGVVMSPRQARALSHVIKRQAAVAER
jgi:hypothetical protein